MRFCLYFFLFISVPTFASDFTMGVNVHPDSFSDNAKAISIIKSYGFHSVRIDYNWGDVENEHGQLSASKKNTELFLKSISDHGLTPILILNGCKENKICEKPKKPSQLREYLKYVRWVANHFKNKNVTYEIWNEWTLSDPNRHDSQSITSAEEYFKITSESYAAIKKIDPNAKVIAGGINPTVHGEQGWLFELFKLGIARYIDGVSIHPYHYNDSYLYDPKTDVKIIESLEEDIIKINNGKTVPLFITELGFPVFSKTKFTQSQVVDYLGEYISILKGINYVKGVWWYDLIDDCGNNNDRECRFGILHSNMKPKEYSSFFNANK